MRKYLATSNSKQLLTYDGKYIAISFTRYNFSGFDYPLTDEIQQTLRTVYETQQILRTVYETQQILRTVYEIQQTLRTVTVQAKLRTCVVDQ